MYPDDSVQSVVGDWWRDDPSGTICRGRLLRAFVPYPEMKPLRLVPEGRGSDARQHDRALFRLEPYRISDPTPQIGTLPVAAFPEASPQVMRAERTFWEKATAIHVFCRGGKVRGADRVSRHWYDLVGLEQTGHAQSAISDRDLARSVARHKAAFFRENDGSGNRISYDEAVGGRLRLVPEDRAMELLSQDYAAMLRDGLFFKEPLAFDVLIKSCRTIQDRANAGAER